MKNLPAASSQDRPAINRPTYADIDSYAWLILQHERKPLSALPECRREAELQLWAMWALIPPEQRGQAAIEAAFAKSRAGRRSEATRSRAKSDFARRPRKAEVAELSPA